MLDLYVLPAAGPVLRWRASPVKHPEKVDMVIFRENTEDIYAGIEYVAGSAEAQKVSTSSPKTFPKTSPKSASAPSKPSPIT